MIRPDLAPGPTTTTPNPSWRWPTPSARSAAALVHPCRRMDTTNSSTLSWDNRIRMSPCGDLYRRPLTRAEMLAPLAWHETHLAKAVRYGVLADGTIGFEVAS